MFSSSSTLSPRISTSSSFMSSATTEILSAAQSRNLEGKIPLTSKEEVEKKLASILAQIQQNRVTHLNLASASLGHFYGLAYTLNGHGNTICSLTVLKNGVFVSGSSDKSIKLWDLTSHSCLATLRGHTNTVFALAALPNGELASGSDDTTIKLWDLSSYSSFATLQGHAYGVWALAVFPNGLLASGSADKTIKLWDWASRSCLATLRGHGHWVTALTVLPNGQLVSGSNDKTIKLWDLASGTCLSTLRGHALGVYALAVMPNGLLASGSFDKTIKLWGLASHSRLSTLRGHTWSVYALAVLSNGLLASSSNDTTIKLWSLSSQSCLATLQGHTGLVYTLTALPNNQLASGSADNTIQIWEPKTLSAQYLSSILNALKRNTSVVDLDLSGNRDILDDLIDPLIAILIPDTSSGLKSNTSLKTIDLRKTGVSKKGVKKLEKTIQHQRLSIEVLSDCPIEWMIIYFLITFCRANRNSPFTDSGLDLCKHGEIGPFLGMPCGFFTRPRKDPSTPKRIELSPS